MDLEHAKKSTVRFHKATIVLAAHITNLPVQYILDKDISLPIIARQKDLLYCVSIGNKDKKGDDDFITPYVVNGSFSLELNLKLLSFLETNEWPRGHELFFLYQKLSLEARKRIEVNFEKISSQTNDLYKQLDFLKKHNVDMEWSIPLLLKRSDQAFQKWRYAFESKPGCFAGYSQIHKSIREEIENHDKF